MRFLVLLAGIAAFGASASATEWLTDGAPRSDTISLSDGLADSTIFSVAQDSLGRIWFGTASGGANVYDGHGIRAFVQGDDPESLSHSGAGQVLVGADGTVWVGTWGGGLNRLVSPEGRFERINPASEPARIQTLFEDGSGRLWVGDGNSGLLRYDGGSVFTPVVRADGNPLQRIWAVAQSTDERLWVGSDAGLFVLRSADGQLESVGEFGSDSPRTLLALRDTLWIGGNDGLYVLDLTTDRVRRIGVDLPTVNVLASGPDGRVLVGSLAGLFALDPAREALVSPVVGSERRLFSDRNVRDILVDRTGMIWLATREAGAIKLMGRRTGFGGFATHDELETVDTLVELAPSELLIGSRRGLWRLHEALDGPHLSRVADSEPFFVNQLARIESEVLVATRSGLRVYERGVDRLRDDPRFEELNGLSVTVVAAGERGLWAGTWAEGLLHLPDDGGPVTKYWTGGDPALPDDYLAAIVPEGDGLWLGHWYEGFSRLDLATGEVERFAPDGERAADRLFGHVHSLAPGRGAIWVGTSFGLARLDRSTRELVEVTISRDNEPTSVYRIELDADGYVWLATSRGVKRLDPTDLSMVHFGEADGLVSTEFYARSGTRGEGGHIYFGGVGGLVSFDPRRVREQFPVPEVHFIDAAVDGRVLPAGPGQLVLAPGTRELRVSFAAADFKDPRENRYQYRLIGDVNEWSSVSDRNVASFAALPAGDYTLEVRARNSNGGWNMATPASLDVRVLPFWWQTWPGRFAVALVLIGLIYGWHRMRTDRILASNRALEAEVRRQTQDLTQANRQLAEAAATDFLTGLPNRRGFLAQLNASGQRRPGTIALADVDDFKVLNDAYGHELGDAVLHSVGVAISSVLRPADSVARWGGEEFILYFDDLGLEAARPIAERVRRAVENVQLPSEADGQHVSVTIGVARLEPEETLSAAIERADQSLYSGKQSGKNRVVVAA